jgi:hypothetical protein
MTFDKYPNKISVGVFYDDKGNVEKVNIGSDLSANTGVQTKLEQIKDIIGKTCPKRITISWGRHCESPAFYKRASTDTLNISLVESANLLSNEKDLPPRRDLIYVLENP